MYHSFSSPIAHISLPGRFTYPFCYTPHPLSVQAAEEVQRYIAGRAEWQDELACGKMFGVLVVQTAQGEVGYLAAFSGLLAGRNVHSFFVPPVYDLQHPGGFFKPEEDAITQINHRITALEQAEARVLLLDEIAGTEQDMHRALADAKAQLQVAKADRASRRQSGTLTAEEEAMLIRESQYQKAEYKRLARSWRQRLAVLYERRQTSDAEIEALKAARRRRSAALQLRLFGEFRLLNARGEVRTLCDIFAHTAQKVPPAGAGECAAPRLLQYAYLHGMKPLAMAEFWWGASPKGELREHGRSYPACRGKCAPILNHMLQGLDVEDSPLAALSGQLPVPVILYEDAWLLVVDKPAGMLSAPGREAVGSVQDWACRHTPQAEEVRAVHRLDMDTSGVLLLAKTREVYRRLQAQFAACMVHKRYVALLEGLVTEDSGAIDLPLAPDWLDRPRQCVDFVHGKSSCTRYEVLARTADGRTRVVFFPLTGRTHQLRVHAAHSAGLHCPIVGDRLYGIPADRLHLHAESVEFRHPVTGERMKCVAQVPF